MHKKSYKFVFCQQNELQNNNVNVANMTLENMCKFRYLGTTVVTQNWIDEDTMDQLNSENAVY